jgi:hypothetical protein
VLIVRIPQPSRQLKSSLRPLFHGPGSMNGPFFCQPESVIKVKELSDFTAKASVVGRSIDGPGSGGMGASSRRACQTILNRSGYHWFTDICATCPDKSNIVTRRGGKYVRKSQVREQTPASAEAQILVMDLLVTNFTVSLHLYSESGRLRSANRLIELPINPELGGQDPNFRLLRIIKDAGQAELDRQGPQRRCSRICPPERVNLGDLARFPAMRRKTA